MSNIRDCRPQIWLSLLAVMLLLVDQAVIAQVPALLNYQGRVGVGGAAFDGTGQFKFALVNADASLVFWRSSADANSDGEPDLAVSLPVNKGLFSVHLGDPALPNMAVLPVSVFNNTGVFLRVWFNDGAVGFQRLSPDQRIVSVGYAMMSASVADGAVSMAKLAPDVVTAISSAGSGSLWVPSQIPGLDSSKIISGLIDPARIPASIARVSQVDALSAQVQALSQTLTALADSIPQGLLASSPNPADPKLLGMGYGPAGSLAAPSWVNVSSAGAPGARSAHSGIWAGDSFLVWGGNVGGGNVSALGAAYQPSTDKWTAISTVGAPSARSSHSAVWSGSEMIIWGGFDSDYLNTGGRYNPSTLQWVSTPTSGAPSARLDHVAAWTGSRLLIWGGRNSGGVLGDGALLDPATGTWTPVSLPNAPSARHSASAVWTGTSLLVWGGESTGGSQSTGAELVFGGNGLPIQWRPVATVGAPSGRSGHFAVWTGSKLLVWGGKQGNSLLSDGASYDPNSSAWTPLPGTGAPAARANGAGIWTGSEFVIFGGETVGGATATGGVFDPAAGTWRELANGGAPVARSSPAFAWTGSRLVVFGGKAGANPIGAGQMVSPLPLLHIFRKF